MLWSNAASAGVSVLRASAVGQAVRRPASRIPPSSEELEAIAGAVRGRDPHLRHDPDGGVTRVPVADMARATQGASLVVDTLAHHLRVHDREVSLERRRALEPLVVQLLRRAKEGPRRRRGRRSCAPPAAPDRKAPTPGRHQRPRPHLPRPGPAGRSGRHRARAGRRGVRPHALPPRPRTSASRLRRAALQLERLARDGSAPVGEQRQRAFERACTMSLAPRRTRGRSALLRLAPGRAQAHALQAVDASARGPPSMPAIFAAEERLHVARVRLRRRRTPGRLPMRACTPLMPRNASPRTAS